MTAPAWDVKPRGCAKRMHPRLAERPIAAIVEPRGKVFDWVAYAPRFNAEELQGAGWARTPEAAMRAADRWLRKRGYIRRAPLNDRQKRALALGRLASVLAQLNVSGLTVPEESDVTEARRFLRLALDSVRADFPTLSAIL